MREKSNSFEFTIDVLLEILDYSSDEIFVLDKNEQIVYVNSMCERHYGLKPSDVIGKYNDELFTKGYWKPSIVPDVFEHKKPCYITQETYLGTKLLTSAIPILNDEKEIEYVVINAAQLQKYKTLYNDGRADLPYYQSDNTESSIISNNEEMKAILNISQKVAKTDSTILILGETGTGKGVLANYLHEQSERKDQAFVNINCAALPKELLESELFGYVEGAFTGAKSSGKVGLIESAHGGTLFLDEIGTVSLEIQAKLLQVLQDKTFIPIGSNEERKVDIRIIAATNENLFDMVEQKKFREDLYYRLNVVDVTLPPLRERREDIILLTYSFLNKFNNLYNKNTFITNECLDILIHYSWPGNIRQLRNVIERLVILSESSIKVSDLPDLIKANAGDTPTVLKAETLNEALQNTTRLLVRNSYLEHRTSRRVAEDLGVSQTTAARLIREHCQDLTSKNDK